MDSDWIKLNRSLLLNEIWRSDPFSKGQAWVDLLLVANWKDNQAVVKGNVILLERGQLCRSMKQLSIRWKWSVGKVKRFLETCSELGQISFENWPKNGTQKNAVTTLITIVNYAQYQDGGTQTERKRNANGTQTETDKEVKNKPPIIPHENDCFSVFWKAYPKKTGKGNAEKAWKKIKHPSETLALILSALEWQKTSHDWTKENGTYIPHPTTYINGRRWEDEPQATGTGDWRDAY